jgi:glucose/arabinose dehydrogenase
VSTTQPVLDGLDFPTSVAVTDDAAVYVAESGLPFVGAAPGGRIWRLEGDGGRHLVIGGLRAPVNGLTAHGDRLLVAEGGAPGRISLLDRDGAQATVLDDLPGPGNYHTNMAVAGPDGWIYFSQGALTNTGVIGLDSYEIGWLAQLPHAYDLPGLDIVLAGDTVETPDPFDSSGRGRARTGAFAPFGSAHDPGARIPGRLPATAAVMRVRPDGSDLQLVAWGLRNAWALGFLPDGRLLAIDQGADDRGSRPVGQAPDALFDVRPGAWYGWPDFVAGRPVTDPAYAPARGPRPGFVLGNHAELPAPQRPLLEFEPHVAAVKFDLLPGRDGRSDCLLVALFGDEAPMTAVDGPRRGRSVVAVDTTTWRVRPMPLLVDLHRPIDVRLDPSGTHLYVLDFGRFEMTDSGVQAEAGTGRLWRLPLSDLDL